MNKIPDDEQKFPNSNKTSQTSNFNIPKKNFDYAEEFLVCAIVIYFLFLKIYKNRDNKRSRKRLAIGIGIEREKGKDTDILSVF